jgi:hypothetical protein
MYPFHTQHRRVLCVQSRLKVCVDEPIFWKKIKSGPSRSGFSLFFFEKNIWNL